VNQAPLQLPSVHGMTLRRIDEHTIEAEMPRTQALNSLFESFSANGITVTSMRTKTNRLEELFVRLVENGRQGPGHQEPSKEKVA
jgi:ABC-2 type transport system ATP-binding protein